MVAPLRSGDPARLGSYQLLGRIGAGGQGTVFLGEDGAGVQVAVKTLSHDLLEDEVARRRFASEVALVRQVSSFCVAEVLDADLEGERPYIVSEYVPGPSLQEAVATRGSLAPGALGRLAVSTVTALVAVHDAGIVHRDFKPHNVLLGPDGPRVIDFGIARLSDSALTATGQILGTVAYMSPEQIGGSPVGPATDMFSWAVTMAYAASGRKVFEAETVPAIMQRILFASPDLPTLPDALAGVMATCLAKDPATRPTAKDVLLQLITRSPGEAKEAVRADVLAHGTQAVEPSPGPDGPIRGAPQPTDLSWPEQPTSVMALPPPPPPPAREGRRFRLLPATRGGRTVLISICVVGLLLLGTVTIVTGLGTRGGPSTDPPAASPSAPVSSAIATGGCTNVDADFSTSSLDPRWTRANDAGGTSTFESGGGRLVIKPAPGADVRVDKQGRVTAPYLSTRVSGDFVLETQLTADPALTYQAAGLLLLQGQSNYVRLERGFGTFNAIAFEYALNGVHVKLAGPFKGEPQPTPAGSNTVSLRLVRTGSEVSALWRDDQAGGDWKQLLGTVSIPGDLTAGVDALDTAPAGNRTPFTATFRSLSIRCKVP